MDLSHTIYVYGTDISTCINLGKWSLFNDQFVNDVYFFIYSQEFGVWPYENRLVKSGEIEIKEIIYKIRNVLKTKPILLNRLFLQQQQCSFIHFINKYIDSLILRECNFIYKTICIRKIQKAWRIARYDPDFFICNKWTKKIQKKWNNKACTELIKNNLIK